MYIGIGYILPTVWGKYISWMYVLVLGIDLGRLAVLVLVLQKSVLLVSATKQNRRVPHSWAV